jgi:peroxiredoxin Q/BCP
MVYTLSGLWAAVALAEGPVAGSPAPAFRLQDQQGEWHTLENYRGKWLVMYFYAGDNLPTDVAEAREFNAALPAYKSAEIHVIGVSVDGVVSHKAFAEREKLGFPILADSGKDTSRAYGALKKYLGVQELAKRDTFLIDPNGRIVKHYVEVEPKGHPQAVLTDIEKLKK